MSELACIPYQIDEDLKIPPFKLETLVTTNNHLSRKQYIVLGFSSNAPLFVESQTGESIY